LGDQAAEAADARGQGRGPGGQRDRPPGKPVALVDRLLNIEDAKRLVHETDTIVDELLERRTES
jgi:hypothetical protein